MVVSWRVRFRVCFFAAIGLLSVIWVVVGIMLVSGIVVVLLLVWFASASCRPRFSRSPSSFKAVV